MACSPQTFECVRLRWWLSRVWSTPQRTRTMAAAALDEYDLAIYPGFYRRPMARWNEDGSCAPMARARGPKGEAFQPLLKQSDIDDDIGHIEHEVRGGSASRSPARDRSRFLEVAVTVVPARATRGRHAKRASRDPRPPVVDPIFVWVFRRAGVSRRTPSIPDAALTSPPLLADRHRQETQEEEAAAPETQGREPPRGEGGGRVSASRPRDAIGRSPATVPLESRPPARFKA
jgi:hypothetical protein